MEQELRVRRSLFDSVDGHAWEWSAVSFNPVLGLADDPKAIVGYGTARSHRAATKAVRAEARRQFGYRNGWERISPC